MDWFWFWVFTVIVCLECMIMAFVKGVARLNKEYDE